MANSPFSPFPTASSTFINVHRFDESIPVLILVLAFPGHNPAAVCRQNLLRVLAEQRGKRGERQAPEDSGAGVAGDGHVQVPSGPGQGSVVARR